MRACYVAEITTPKNYLLNGLWFGPKKPRRLIIWIHGLTGSVFSTRHLVDALVDKGTAVLIFNNRGFGKINNIKRLVRKKSRIIEAGSAHEIFKDCVDDIDGVVRFARTAGAKDIFLAGHSTGCQKAVYWASKRKADKNVKGIVLLAPVSDHAAALKTNSKRNLEKAVGHARALVRKGKGDELMPRKFLTKWSLDDAQRFLSLYTPDSAETIFPYEQSGKIPRALRAVEKPILVLWAQKDEYADRSAQKIESWFVENLKVGDKVIIVGDAKHAFKGGEKLVARAIRQFISR